MLDEPLSPIWLFFSTEWILTGQRSPFLIVHKIHKMWSLVFWQRLICSSFGNSSQAKHLYSSSGFSLPIMVKAIFHPHTEYLHRFFTMFFVQELEANWAVLTDFNWIIFFLFYKICRTIAIWKWYFCSLAALCCFVYFTLAAMRNA